MPGAGFFVAPGKVVTCFHVIGDNPASVVRWERDGRPPVEVPVAGRVLVLANRGRPIPALDRDYPDIAVLEVAGLDGHPCVGIDTEWPAHEDSFQVFGYPQEGGAVQLTPARLTYRGAKGILPTTYLDLASDTVKPGMSGAAVLNLRSGAVCGVIVASKHPAHPDGALAIPWSAVDTDLSEVLAANRAFHLKDRRWNAAEAAGPAGWPLSEVTDPFALEVHRPVQLEDAQPGLPVLPPYVPREHDQVLGQVVRAAADGRSGIAVLVGGSSTGKTRACWEALQVLRDQDPPWRLWHPIDPSRPGCRAAGAVGHRAADRGVAERGPVLPRHRRWAGRAGCRRAAGSAARPRPGPGASTGHHVARILELPDRSPGRRGGPAPPGAGAAGRARHHRARRVHPGADEPARPGGRRADGAGGQVGAGRGGDPVPGRGAGAAGPVPQRPARRQRR